MTSPRQLDRLGHELAKRLRAAHAHLRRRSNRVFATFGVTTDQFVLLSVLAERGQATQQELVRGCSSDTATIGAMLALLETQRWVSRAPHPRDRRAWSVALTPGGRRLANRMRQASAPLRTELAGLFSEPELKNLIEYLDRLAGAMSPSSRKRTAAGSKPFHHQANRHPKSL